MRILIGTPVHECKDYAMERWLESVSKFDYPYELLLVDNSDGLNYVNKLNKYCQKYGLINYIIEHIEIPQECQIDERLAKAREVIRQKFLAKDYDAWCSLECDIIAPPDALTKLVKLIGDYWMVRHAYPSRGVPNGVNDQLGLALAKRSVLEKYSFMEAYGYVDPLQPNCWYGNDVWFIMRLDRDNESKLISVAGIIDPIYHLDK